MPSAGFEPANQRWQAHDLDGAATGIGILLCFPSQYRLYGPNIQQNEYYTIITFYYTISAALYVRHDVVLQRDRKEVCFLGAGVPLTKYVYGI